MSAHAGTPLRGRCARCCGAPAVAASTSGHLASGVRFALIVAVTLIVLCSCAKLDEPTASPAGHDKPSSWLIDITSSSGLNFTHQACGTGERHMPEIVGSGCALFDFDNDGDLDVYLVNGAPELGKASSVSASTPRNQLFRHDDGVQFTNVTEQSGLGDAGYGMGVAIGDVDNDGWVDVFVSNFGPDQLYRNRGDGTFENITAKAGIHVPGWSCSAAFLDFDRDGFLDLYITQYVQYRPATKCTDLAGRPDYCGPKSYPPAVDVLLRNNGDATFTDVSKQSGITAAAGAGLGVVCADFNADGWIDIYVANDGYANFMWINQRNGTFIDVANAWGCALNAQGNREAGMGVVAQDLNGDLTLDLFITHLANETNTLYSMLDSKRGMVDATGSSGLGPDSVPFTGFGVIANDLDLDGQLDLLIANGRVARQPLIAGAAPPPPWDVYAEPNLVYMNLGEGRFAMQSQHVHEFADPIEISRGLAAGDLDHDGRIDLLLSNTEGPARIFLNKSPSRGRWIAVRPIDPRYSREAIGAMVRVEAGERAWIRSIARNDSYLSASDPVAHVGLGSEVDRVTAIIVTWPDGLIESFEPECIDCTCVLKRGTGTEMAR